MRWPPSQENALKRMMLERPRPSQAQMGERLGMTRSKVAGKIARLKGYKRRRSDIFLDISYHNGGFVIVNRGGQRINIEPLPSGWLRIRPKDFRYA